ncbi:MAG: hypothetical protein LBD76_05930 [Prevotellaceae bacterium]|nr:hypothetical protein [Prevotellaceae bacterium]
MRRLFHILLNALVTVMLLASVITPHHHHGDVVCISTDCFTHESSEAGHECEGDFTNCCSHHHDNDDEEDTSDDNCIAKATYLVSGQSEIKPKLRPYDGHHHNTHFVPVFLYTVNLYDTDAKFIYLTKRRYKERDFFRESGNVNRTNGLRAPPYTIA